MAEVMVECCNEFCDRVLRISVLKCGGCGTHQGIEYVEVEYSELATALGTPSPM